MSDYDEIIKNLYLGNIHTAHDYKFLHLNNIKYVLSLTNNYVQIDKKKIKHIQFHITDTPFEDIITLFGLCHAFIRDGLNRGYGVLVHCNQGVSRSASIVISLLMSLQQKSFNEAYIYIKRRRSVINPNFGFQAQLKLYEKMNYSIKGNNTFHGLFNKFLLKDNNASEQKFNVEGYLKYINSLFKTDDGYMPPRSHEYEKKQYTASNGIVYKCIR